MLDTDHVSTEDPKSQEGKEHLPGAKWEPDTPPNTIPQITPQGMSPHPNMIGLGHLLDSHPHPRYGSGPPWS